MSVVFSRMRPGTHKPAIPHLRLLTFRITMETWPFLKIDMRHSALRQEKNHKKTWHVVFHRWTWDCILIDMDFAKVVT